MAWPVSQQFQDTLAGSDQHVALLVQVWNHDDKIADLVTFITGSVQVDVTQTTRRTVTLSFVALGFDYSESTDNIVPANITDILHPATGNEVKCWRGFIWGATDDIPPTALGAGLVNSTPGVPFAVPGYPGVTAELCPLGVFSISQPDTQDTGDSLTVDVSGNDRSALMSARKWTKPFVIAAGTNINRAAQAIFEDRMPDFDFDFNFVPTNYALPSTIFGTDLAGSNDPFADVTSLFTAAGMVLYFDVEGNPTAEPMANPTSQTTVFDGLYVEGDINTAEQYGRIADESQTFNGVQVIANGNGGPPVQAFKWDTDPTSPTYYDPNFPKQSKWGPRPFITETSLIPSPGQSIEESQTQAQLMANNLYLQVHTILDTPSFQAIPNPALQETDLLYLAKYRMNLQGAYTSAQMTMPLDSTELMSVTCNPMAVAA